MLIQEVHIYSIRLWHNSMQCITNSIAKAVTTEIICILQVLTTRPTVWHIFPPRPTTCSYLFSSTVTRWQLYIVQVMQMVVSKWPSALVGLVTEQHHYNRRHKLRYVFIVECGIACILCAMCVFKVRASASSPRLPLCQICFFCRLQCWASPWRKIMYSVIYSLNQSPSLFDALGT